MKRKTMFLSLWMICMLVFTGCVSANPVEKDVDSVSADNAELIREVVASPNEKYVSNASEIVQYQIQVYQNSEFTVIVKATSNWSFFDDMNYSFDYNEAITSEDVQVNWLTLMGSKEDSETNQIAIADVIISKSNEIISERKINFSKKVIDTVIDSIKK